MIKRAGLTRIDLVVALSCLVFILINVQLITAGGRERSKLEVCKANLRALTAAWNMYADDNNEKIPSGDVWYSWTFPSSIGGPQLAWCEWPHPFPHPMPPSQVTNNTTTYPPGSQVNEATWQHAIAEGLLWKYVNDFDIYKCPVGDKKEYVTYSMSHSMNTWRSPPTGSAGPGSVSRTISIKSQIRRPAERFVFLDTGYGKRGAFFLNYDGGGAAPPGSFGDHRPKRHGNGTTFSFADGHSEYRKWSNGSGDPPTEISGWGGQSNPCFCDWRWLCKVTWGDIPLDCTTGNQCED